MFHPRFTPLPLPDAGRIIHYSTPTPCHFIRREYPMRRFALLVLVILPFLAPAAEPAGPMSRIAFGSCVHQDKPQPIWDSIVAAKPDLFLLIGDAIYADVPKDTKMHEAYAKLAAQPGFKALRAACPVLAVWDDHDYGKNDAGAEFPQKDDSKKQFLTFFGEPPGSPRW